MPTDQNNLDGKIIKKLFDNCLDLSPEEQLKIINAADVSPQIKKHVLGLLQHSLNEMDLTQAMVDSLAVSLDIKPLVKGMRVGAYQLQMPIGEGGQGEVWKAKRVDGKFNHLVAIKFLKPVHDEFELARFQAERELLAGLNHPNIAQLLDGGELENSRPYMVLELVEGLPILDYAKQNKFGLQKYLTSFIHICDAISYAHSYSIIHRDIKPSNVYVNNDGVVKLLDFGIAKFVNNDEKDAKTQPIMTLAYSSPEQISGAKISTSTDIYALGLLLYEMLTDQRAHVFNSDIPAKLMQEITDKTPNLPSIVLQHSQLNRAYTSQALKGDLDKLIMMALKKEPERRYSTVRDLCQDVKNYLKGKPLIAVGDGWVYLGKKFVSRNPASSILASIVLLLLILYPLSLLKNQKALTNERDIALKAQRKAQIESEISNRTTDFLVNILESASPLGSRGEQINLEDVLESAERQLTHGLENQPRIKTNLLGKLASIRHHLGNTGQAINHYKSALKLFEESNDVEGQFFMLGQLSVMSVFDNNEIQALEYKSMAETLKSQISNPNQLAWHDARMATLALELNQKNTIEPLLKQTLSQLKTANVNDAELLGRIYNELSLTSISPNESFKYINLALKYAQDLHGSMHPLTLNRQLNRSNALKRLERFDEAEQDLNKVILNAEKLFTRKHIFFLNALAELGALYHDTGRFSETEKIYSEVLITTEEIWGIENIRYVLEINNLAYLYEDMGQFEKAEPMYRKSITLRREYHSSNPYRIASSEGNLARLLAKTNRHEDSQTIIDRIIPVFEKNKASNRQNQITAIANTIGQNPTIETCKIAIKEIKNILPEVYQTSKKSWRRMYNELWLGELAQKCQNNQLSSKLLTSAAKMSEVIYKTNSEGQILIQNKIKQLLNTSQ